MAHYIVYRNKIRKNLTMLREAFKLKGLDFQLFYSVKTNFSNPVLQIIKGSQCQYEILSTLEWEKVKNFNPKKIVLNGPAKKKKLVKEILEKVNVLYFNIDNDTDLEILKESVFLKFRKKIKIGLRIFIDVEGVWSRFGYELCSKEFFSVVKRVRKIAKLSGFHFHFSTNDFKIENYRLMFSKLKDFINKSEVQLEFLDIGGGLPAANESLYHSEVYQKLPELICKYFPESKIISEAGRNIVADAVKLKTKVISIKQIKEKKFQVNIDTNILHFPCYFEKKFWVEYLSRKGKKEEVIEIEIFGNSCMQVDKISDLMLINQKPQLGDKVVIHNVGAYSFSQAANFISKIPEVKMHE